MDDTQFLNQFSLIEKRLASMIQGFDLGNGFGALLMALAKNKNIDAKTVVLLGDIFAVRNKIVGFPPRKIKITPPVIKKIDKVKNIFKI